MQISVSLYPLLRIESGITMVFEEDESDSPIINAKLHKKMVRKILQEHDELACGELEHENFTLILVYNNLAQEYPPPNPLVVYHSRPHRFSFSYLYENLPKDQLWKRVVYDAARMLDADLSSDMENEVDFEDNSKWQCRSDDEMASSISSFF